jgi:O-antigen/teichoic acid export membrane protein
MILHDYSGYLLNTSDRIVMDVVKVDIRSIGFYNIAYIFGGYFAFFETAMGMAASPIFLKYYAEKKMIEARRLTYLSQCVFLIVSFITCLWLKEIFFAFIKIDELKSAYSLGIIIIMGYNYKPMYQASTNILFYNERTSAILKISLGAGILNILLNFLLIPVFGFKVAAFTTLGCLLFMGFRGFYLKEYLETKTLEYYPMRWLFLIITITGLVYLLKDISVFFKILISGILAILALVSYKKNKEILFQD